VLLDLIQRRGESSETYGILGRVYKDRWESAKKAGSTALARGLLDKAIAAYLKGFEADWRDAYPGVNAITLMTLREPPDPRKDELLPVVTYAVKRRTASGKPDYWDYATLLELAVIGEDEAAAGDALGNALAAIREVWEPETTVRNLRLIREARESRGAAKPWTVQIEAELANRTAPPAE
ncbi:MAG TPA: TRAFs-binding domain-containing protein, partial [Candidatus Udaeobacter sp.]|nr:TRAFs-binding domain-containing protein [Candidatus Udaeobacter sp.]